jgi:hypothetical protein
MPIFNFGSPFDSLPLRNYTPPNPVTVANLVSINSITFVPPLTFSATSDNLAVATAAISGKNLLVTGLQPGIAHITAKATDLDGAIVSQNFTVTVAASPPRIADISTRRTSRLRRQRSHRRIYYSGQRFEAGSGSCDRPIAYSLWRCERFDGSDA